MSENNDEGTGAKIRLWSHIPLDLHNEMEAVRTSYAFPPSKTQFVIHVIRLGLKAVKRHQKQAKN